MHRRVDVRAAVRAEGVDRQRQDVALSHLFQEFELYGRIARVHRRARGIECRRDIDPPLPAQLSRPLVRDTPHQETHGEPRVHRLRDGHVANLLEVREPPTYKSPPSTPWPDDAESLACPTDA